MVGKPGTGEVGNPCLGWVVRGACEPVAGVLEKPEEPGNGLGAKGDWGCWLPGEVPGRAPG